MTVGRRVLAQGAAVAAPPRRPRLKELAAALGGAAVVCAAAGCGGGHFEVPVPAVQVAAQPIPPAEPASIGLPVTLAMSALRVQLDSVYPAADSLTQAQCSALGGLVCHQYVYVRDTLDLQMQGDRFALLTRLHYRARVALPRVGGLASCGYAPETMRGAEMRFATSLYWRTDWRLASRGTTLNAALLDPCNVTALGLNASPLMQKILDGQLRSLVREVDSIIPTLADVRPVADSLWRAMQEPVPLDSTPDVATVWLVLNPETVKLAALAGAGEAASTAVVLTARPRVVIGARPTTTVRPLPSLALANPVSDFRVPVDVELPFAELSQKVTGMLVQETARENPHVTDVRIWGVADTAVVKVAVAGKVTGSFYMLGRVAYDAATRTVLITDLRYTLASQSTMTRLKASIGAPLIRRAIDEATGHGRLDVGAQLDKARDQLTQMLNYTAAPGVALAGAVRQVRIAGLYTTPTSFVLRVVLEGEARVDVR